MQNDRLKKVSIVLTNHLGNAFGDDLSNVASQILHAENMATVSFGVSTDADLISQIQVQIRDLQRSFALLSREGTTFIPTGRAIQIIAQTMRQRPMEPHPVDAAKNSLLDLSSWLDEMLRHPEFKKQATRKRNWRAASVARACRRVWAVGHLNLRDGTTGGNHYSLTHGQLEALSPSSEKHDAPGPFGRFLEDVNLALDILDKHGEPFSAASALRSLAQASKQESKK